MPIYEYRCDACGKEEDLLLLSTKVERPEIDCPDCNSRMRKLFSVPRPPIIVQTSRDMALSSLNSKETNHMSNYAKMMAARGL